MATNQIKVTWEDKQGGIHTYAIVSSHEEASKKLAECNRVHPDAVKIEFSPA